MINLIHQPKLMPIPLAMSEDHSPSTPHRGAVAQGDQAILRHPESTAGTCPWYDSLVCISMVIQLGFHPVGIEVLSSARCGIHLRYSKNAKSKQSSSIGSGRVGPDIRQTSISSVVADRIHDTIILQPPNTSLYLVQMS